MNRKLPWLFLFILVFSSLFVEAQKDSLVYDESFKSLPVIIKADSLADIWQWENAIKLYEKILGSYTKEKTPQVYIYCRSKIGGAHKELDRYEIAYEILTQTIKEGEEILGQYHPEVARAYNYLGYYYLGGSDANLDSTRKASNYALNLRVKWLPPDHLDIADSYHQLGRYYAAKNEFLDSKKFHENAIKIYESKLDSNSILLARAYRYYGLALRGAHYPAETENYRKRAYEIYKSNPGSPRKELSYIIDNLGATSMDSEDYSSAKKYYQEAYDLMLSKKGVMPVELVVPLNNLASANGYLGNMEIAKKLFRKSMSLNLGSANTNYAELTWTYEQYADVLSNYGQIDSAVYYLLRAFDSLSKVGYTSLYQECSLSISLSEYFLRQRNFDGSFDQIQNAMSVLDPSIKGKSIETNPSFDEVVYSDLLYEALSTKARIFYEYAQESDKPFDLKESIRIYELLDLLTDRLRNNLYSEQSKMLLGKYYKRDAGFALQAMNDAYQISDDLDFASFAFKLMEKNRYAKIFSNQVKANEITRVGLPDSLYDDEVDLATRMEALRFDLSESETLDKKATIEVEIFNLNKEYKRFQEKVAEEYPTYFQVNFEQLLKLSDIQNKLDSKTQVLEYFWGDSVCYVVSVSKNHRDFKAIQISDSTYSLLSKFLNQIAHQSSNSLSTFSPAYFTSYRSQARELFKIFLEPFLVNRKKRIIISPDGLLSFLPFEALISKEGGRGWKGTSYVISDYDIHYIYSCNLYFNRKTGDGEKHPNILAMAFSNHLNGISFYDSPVNDLPRDYLPEIAGSSYEVDAIRDMFGQHNCVTLKGQEATETAFKSLAESFEIIHLSVHGKGDRNNELSSSLYFKFKKDSINNGRLLAHELYSLNLKNVRLTVLSACETGIGKEIKGEGIFSVARGFAYAGCPSIVMSLWNVNDVMSANLLSYFYQYLKRGDASHHALRKAKLKFIKEADFDQTVDPFYWAGFVHYGDTRPVTGEVSYGLKWFFIIGVLLVVIFFVNKKSLGGS